MRKIYLLLLFILSVTGVYAQQAQPVEMADAMYQNGRIYVVIATIAIIFCGLAIYLFRMDSRLKKLEREK